jgi:hypothetical protein
VLIPIQSASSAPETGHYVIRSEHVGAYNHHHHQPQPPFVFVSSFPVRAYSRPLSFPKAHRSPAALLGRRSSLLSNGPRSRKLPRSRLARKLCASVLWDSKSPYTTITLTPIQSAASGKKHPTTRPHCRCRGGYMWEDLGSLATPSILCSAPVATSIQLEQQRTPRSDR